MIQAVNCVTIVADKHHPVRVLNVRCEADGGPIGGPVANRLNAYCRFLQEVFPGSRMEWIPGAETAASPAVRAADTQEYLHWLNECYEA